MGSAREFYRLRDPLIAGTAHGSLRRPPGGAAFPISRRAEGRLLGGQPVEGELTLVTDAPLAGDAIIWTSWPGPLAVHRSVLAAFRAAELTGWAATPVPVIDPAGTRHDDYHLLGVTGRCEVAFEPAGEAGVTMAVRRWDGSDLILPADGLVSFPLATRRALDTLAACVPATSFAADRLGGLGFRPDIRERPARHTWDHLSADTMAEHLLETSAELTRAYAAEFKGWVGGPPGPYTVFGSFFLADYLIDRMAQAEGSPDVEPSLAFLRRLAWTGEASVLPVVSDALESCLTHVETRARRRRPGPSPEAVGDLRELLAVADQRFAQAQAAAPPAWVQVRAVDIGPAPRAPERDAGDRSRLIPGDPSLAEAQVNIDWEHAARLYCGGGAVEGGLTLTVERGRQIGDLVWIWGSIGVLPPAVSPSLAAVLEQWGVTGWETFPVRLVAPDGSILTPWYGLRASCFAAAAEPDLTFAGRACTDMYASPHALDVLSECRARSFALRT